MPRNLVRPARQSDIPFIAQSIRGLAEYEKLSDDLDFDLERMRAHFFGARRYAEALVAERDGEAAGYALFFHTYSTFLTRPGIYLEDLYVVPEMRGGGLGRALFAAVAAVARSRDCARLEWSVLDWNEPAIAFYSSLGGRPNAGWTMYRLDGGALEALASGGGTQQGASGG